MKPLFEGIIAGVVMLATVQPVWAEQVCVATAQRTEKVLPNVLLTWDSSFLCANAPDADTYLFTVRVANAASSLEAVKLGPLLMYGSSPRVRGRGPQATLDEVIGLPLMLAPGQTATFTVRGKYTLVNAGGKRANLYFVTRGTGATSGMPFSLDIAVLLRAPGVGP